jgi:hypothetical protein
MRKPILAGLVAGQLIGFAPPAIGVGATLVVLAVATVLVVEEIRENEYEG